MAKDGRKHWRTFALLDNGLEVVGFGKDFDLDDLVEAFFDHKWGVIKMRRPKLDLK
jgi:hypothetical protein